VKFSQSTSSLDSAMSKFGFAAVVGLAAAGGTLKLTWEDCGDSSTHGKTDDVQPSEITIGEDATIVGTGSTDKQIDSGSFEMKLTASMGIKKTYEGKICEAQTFDMPLGIGTVSWAGMDCPVAVGPSEVKVGVHMASVLPARLAKADLALTALDQDGEQAVCVNTHLARETVSVEASCTGTDDFPSTPACYGANVLGKEDVVIKIESFASGAGRFSLTGSGSVPLSCETAFTKDDANKIAFDDCDVSAYAKVKSGQYCSDTDEFKATFNPLGVPLPVSVKLAKVDCGSAVSV